MPKTMAEHYPEKAQIAFQLWQSLRLAPEPGSSLETCQRSLKAFVECVKAVEDEDFDLTKLK